MHTFKKAILAIMAVAALFSAQQVFAKTVKVTMTAKEVDLPVNNKGDDNDGGLDFRWLHARQTGSRK